MALQDVNKQMMKNKRHILIGLCLMVGLGMMGCCKEEAVEFAEFKVTDVSQPTVFADSISSRKCDFLGIGGYVRMKVTITGELDGQAKVLYGTRPDKYIGSFFLEKGKVEFQTENDHYDYKLWLKIQPVDCKKGHLTIRTKII